MLIPGRSPKIENFIIQFLAWDLEKKIYNKVFTVESCIIKFCFGSIEMFLNHFFRSTFF